MILIPAGTFTIGSPVGELGRSLDEAQQTVTLTRSVYVSIREVTQSAWQAVMGWSDPHFPGANHPVEQVTWYDAVWYCNERSTVDELTPAYTITSPIYHLDHLVGATVSWDEAADGYRLLTEAEWEYACRAATSTAFCNGGITNIACDPLDPKLAAVGWYCGNALATTHDVGGKTANAWGLQDMHGNVWEWCWDWYGDYPEDAATDPTGPASGSERVLRGGNWDDEAQGCRSADRGKGVPTLESEEIGFRFCRTVP
jgi:formylglycine-generating enzyme required for sulfatase activity